MGRVVSGSDCVKVLNVLEYANSNLTCLLNGLLDPTCITHLVK